MIYTNLYEDVLIKPCQEGADTLKIISGYASPTMALCHLDDLSEKHLDAHISLFVGMCSSNGLSSSDHIGFKSIVTSDVASFKNRFSCSYIYKTPSVHSKLYVWYKDKELYKAFIGSANYTQNAFRYQRELLAEIKDDHILEYYQALEADSIFCELPEVENLIRIHNDRNYYRRQIYENEKSDIAMKNSNIKHIKVSLLSSKTGEIPNRGGLNWGQRPGREQNQAYIQLPPDVYNSDFFPKAPQWFTIVTDDDKSFFCRRAEKDVQGQTIHTPQNNSYLGEYFRGRLGLANGAFITRQDLEHYGRTDVVFYKIDDENYYMDFSV
ncbi:MAG: NgoFVII family restriction endonuclease [Fibromonadales bacterium]|nr:NgoFVII family restriction endonuclease [Fibromonadales bacterium]